MEDLEKEDIFKVNNIGNDLKADEMHRSLSVKEKAFKRLNHTSRYIDGPFEMRGSEEFILIYMYGRIR